MNSLKIPDKLTLGLCGALCLFWGTTLPLKAITLSNPHQSVSEVNTKIPNNYLALSWQQVWQQIKRKKVAGGSRGILNGFCLISPSRLVDLDSPEDSTNQVVEIWHQNPLFMWKSEPGKFKKIVLKNDDGFYWEQPIEATKNYLFYNGKPLEPGKNYKLVVFAPYETELYQIKVLSPKRHQQIARDLETIQLEAKNANQEEIALAKADYFAQLQMHSDALWELYSLPNSSEGLKETLEQVNTDDFCQ